MEVFSTVRGGNSWLDCLRFMAFGDSISVYIGSSPGEREKEEK